MSWQTKQLLFEFSSVMLPCASLIDTKNRRGSVGSCKSDNALTLRNRQHKPRIWRPSSLANLINSTKKSSSNVFESTFLPDDDDDTVSMVSTSPSQTSVPRKDQQGTIVSVVVVEAKGLPDGPNDGSSRGRYCKIRLGSHTLKTNLSLNSQHPTWKEKLQFHRYNDNLLKVSIWDKGKQKNFMGSCVLDLSQLKRERTHEVWQMLDDGYGIVHLSVTLCNIYKSEKIYPEANLEEKYALLNLHDWKVVGELQVRVVSAKGLGGKPYCLLEVDNESVRTHAVSSSSEVTWDKSFVLVYDITSTLDLKVYDSSLVSALRNDTSGQVIIPLLRIKNGERRWYALKDKNRRSNAKGNCPRVLLEMSLYWNPFKASLKVFKPKELKYNKKSPKFDISLVYKNVEFVKDTFDSIVYLDEGYKHLLEWENREFSCIVLICWLFFWFFFRMWATPLLLLMPFIYFSIFGRHQQEKSFMRGYGIVETSENSSKDKSERSVAKRLQVLPEMTVTITSGIEFLASLAEKMYNLANFKVPFLSYLTMCLLVVASLVLYLIPFNYIMMIFGMYKFSRKYFDPDRIPNNDLVDFLSRIPDTEELRNWKEFNVPEPSQSIINSGSSNVVT